MQKSILVFSKYNYRAVLASLRYFVKHGVNYHIISYPSEDIIRGSKYRDRIIHTLEDETLSAEELKRVLVEKADELKVDEWILLPTAEYLNRFFLKNRNRFKDYLTIPLVESDVYTSLSDKNEFLNDCQQHGFRTPAVKPFDKNKLIPCVAKPEQEFTAEGKRTYPYIITGEKDLSAFLQKEDASDYFFQEYIDGASIYLLYYFKRDGTYSACVQQNGLQQPGGKSILFAWTIDFNHPIVKQFVEYFLSRRFYGFAMIELMKQGSDLYVIECNPRLWGPFQLVVDSGGSLLGHFLCDFYDSNIPLPPKKTCEENVAYLWSDGFTDFPISDIKIHKGFLKKIVKLINAALFNDVLKRGDLKN